MTERIVKRVEAQKYTLGVVYEPDAVDAHGEFMVASEIEKMARGFNRRLLGQAQAVAKILQAFDAAEHGPVELVLEPDAIEKGLLGIQHQDWADDHGEIVESYLAPCDMQIGQEAVTKGTWLMGVVWGDANWTKVQKGEITGYSWGGTAYKRRGKNAN